MSIVGTIPAWLLRHTITVEAFEGNSGTGPVFGEPVEVRCFLASGHEVVRDAEGREVVSSARIFAPLDAPITTQSRITVDRQTAEVLSVSRHDGGGLPTPDHLEVALR